MAEEPSLEKKLASRLGVNAFDSPTIKWWNSTGSPVLDLALRDWKCFGGWAGGKCVELYGPSGAAKTGMCLRAAAACQQNPDNPGRVFFINPPEQGLDTDYLTKNKVQWGEKNAFPWTVLNPFSIEGACGALEDICEDVHDQDHPTIIIVDPLSSLGVLSQSMDESDAGASKSSAAGAKYLHEWFRRGVLWYLAGSKVTIMLTRHQTSSPRVEFGAVDHTTHGTAPDFYAWQRVRMRQMQMEDPTDSNKKGNGAWQVASVRKNKSGRPGAEVSMPWYYDTGWNVGLEVVIACHKHGVLEKRSTGHYVFDGKNLYAREISELYNTSVNVRDELNALLLSSGGVVTTKAREKKTK